MMVRKGQYGSMLIEMVVIMGLIAALTPFLYNHIAERKQEMQNISRANVLLQLQREVEKYLSDKTTRDSISFSANKATLTPSQIGMKATLDNKYAIGLKKDTSTGKISALIAEKDGSSSDLKAAKVANFIGINAGIRSAMNSTYVYGVNGLWKETLADYNLSAATVPEGSTVVSTEYNREKVRYYSSALIVDSDLDMGEYDMIAGLVLTDTLCIGSNDEENCRTAWGEEAVVNDTDIMLMKKCYATVRLGNTTSSYCTSVKAKGLSNTCTTVAAAYTAAGLQAPSGYYYLGNSFAKKACYFVSGAVPSASQLSTACAASDNYACEASGNY